MNGEHVFTEQFLAGEVRDGGAVAAVGVVALVALEPVVHRPARVREHFKFLDGLGHVDADVPFPFSGHARGAVQEFRQGRIRGVR